MSEILNEIVVFLLVPLNGELSVKHLTATRWDVDGYERPRRIVVAAKANKTRKFHARSLPIE